jgi:hypothetical protein
MDDPCTWVSCESVGRRLLGLNLSDVMLLNVAGPEGSWSAGNTTNTDLEWPLEVAEFDAEQRQRSEGVDDKATTVAGVVVTLVGVWSLLNGTVDADRAGNSLVLAPRMCLASLGAG